MCIKHLELCQQSSFRCLINTSLGKFTERLACHRKPHQVLPLPRGLSVPWFTLSTPAPPSRAWDHTLTPPWGQRWSPPVQTHFFWLLPEARKPPRAIRLSLFFPSQPALLEELFIVTVSTSLPPSPSFTQCGLAPPPPPPGTSLIKVTVASVTPS